MNPKAVIFDMDGVIFDSERATFNGWQELADKYGFECLEIPYRQCIGVNEARSREIFLSFYGPDFPYDDLSREQSRNYHSRYDGGRLPQKPGVHALLTALRAAGYFIALASSTRTSTVTSQLRDAGILPFFDRVIGGDMVERSKPNPDIFLKALESTGIAPEDAVVIEDSFNGIRAAHRAGMIPVMVPDMLEPDEEMRSLARHILPDLNTVRALLCPEKGE
ncbi:MAG: HAD family phosphatase [Clostridia bacterium]|nr:HAD family phosphatase [Clostridia bacterium]